MTTAITTTDRSPFLTESDLSIIRRTIAKDASDAEFQYFVKVATLRQLNPLLNQISLQIRNADDASRRASVVITTIHGLRLIASRTGNYMPGRDTTFLVNDDGSLFSATAYVKKFHPASGTWHEISETAYWSEFVQTFRNGGLMGLWGSKPRLMLAKCAEALALRRAFPEDLSGLYTDDEMGQADTNPAGVAATYNETTGEVIDSRPVVQKPTPTAAHQEYTRLYSKLIDLGVTPEKNGKVLPPMLPPTVLEGRVQAAVDHLRALVVQAEDMTETAAA